MHILKEVGLCQILMTAITVIEDTLNLCNQNFTISHNKTLYLDSPLNSEYFSIDIGAPTFPTEITFSYYFCL